jgi:hypothetical protein
LNSDKTERKREAGHQHCPGLGLLGRLGGGFLGRLLLLGLLAFLGGGGGGLLGEQHGVDVGQHPAVRDGDAGQQLPELLVIADRQQHVPRDDPVLLVVPRRVPRQLEDLKKEGEKRERHESGTHFSVAGWGNGGSDLGGEVLEDSGEVDGGAGADALGVAALLEVATDTADGELEAGLHGAGHRLLLRAAAATPGRASLLRHLRSEIHRR